MAITMHAPIRFLAQAVVRLDEVIDGAPPVELQGQVLSGVCCREASMSDEPD